MSLKFLRLMSTAARLNRPALTRAVFFGWNDLLAKSVPAQHYAIREMICDEQRRRSPAKPNVRCRARNCRRSTRGPNMVYC